MRGEKKREKRKVGEEGIGSRQVKPAGCCCVLDE